MSRNTLQPLSLISSLLQPELYDHPVEKCILIETHISWVILAGQYAYKIKKSLNLGFLDFSTLKKRQFFCSEELRLNKRTAADFYLAVVPITGTFEQPVWAGEGNAIEYAVKMRAFPQATQLDRVLASGGLQAYQLDRLAEYIAAFHQQIETAGFDTIYGEPEVLRQPIDENFRQIREHVINSKTLNTLTELENWSQEAFSALRSDFQKRKAAGYIRECHGDLHLQNIAWVDDSPLIFDCIEFSPNLRWIDIISDVAFLVMDLQDRKKSALSYRFLSNYLERTGDYSGLRLLRYYQVYRAMVRAKIDAIRAHQENISPQQQADAEKDFFEYLNLALNYTRPDSPLLIITRGMSGSGKSTIAQQLLGELSAIRIRSDVERKRLYGLQPNDDGRSAVGEGIYSPAATEKTYARLERLTAKILEAGYNVIVDAVFLQDRERQLFSQLAKALKIPFVILECAATVETLRERIRQRKKDVSDADLKVLEMQCAKWKPLGKEECIASVSIDTGVVVDIKKLATEIRTVASLR